MTADQRAPEVDDPTGDDALMTVDELAASVGLTVRTTRYYASRGLLPPPTRRGRFAMYDAQHRARLEMVRALQGHGFTLQAIEGYLASLPADAGVEDLALQRAMLTSWTPRERESLTRRQLEKRAERRLSDDDLDTLEAFGHLTREGERFVVHTGFDVGVRVLGLPIPTAGMVRAGEVITRHMEALALELTEVLREEVVEPFRSAPRTPEQAERFEQTLVETRRLTLESVVAGFQRAANNIITRSLTRR
ncbi:DNA-binding transcriptional MerR regulator [Nocardioides massiliensis]|uniref:DNA-binding transcriptional MerR regulator n=2 Tax=Nocardioides massiliensis TaxID=1325935 RepID=A0ABT9NQM6_9ACTN|nr:MerR family transcriptional regulator [Nocardioides massiliensis]MDP9822360.1 DNA-binding transcriptional MerR regulator [Nocardioides massiliensis]